MSTTICWFRRDLRLGDNPAWSAATASSAVLPVYVLEPELLERAGPYRRRQLLANVAALANDLEQLGGRLHVVVGPARQALPQLALAGHAGAVHANADVTPFADRRDRSLDPLLPLTWHWGGLVHEPGTVLTRAGGLSKVFTPFYKRWRELPVPMPEPSKPPRFVELADPGVPLRPLDGPVPMTAGAEAAHDRLERFLDRVDRYPTDRDLPDTDGTSNLSADLRFGTIGPRELLGLVGDATPGREAFCRQLAWRDWYAHMLKLDPTIVDQAVRPVYDRIPWRDDGEGLAAWKAGLTGYPIVDAGMRQLARTGWMHNRVRMITASFLVKDLLIDWRRGERYFRHLLIDGDVPQNVGNWQWAAGTGNDAAPYFRIFNPTSQSKKFDPAGGYIRRWVPELAGVSAEHIHAPWEAGPLDLAAAGVMLGDTYPAPIVDHADARRRALAVYKAALTTEPS